MSRRNRNKRGAKKNRGNQAKQQAQQVDLLEALITDIILQTFQKENIIPQNERVEKILVQINKLSREMLTKPRTASLKKFCLGMVLAFRMHGGIHASRAKLLVAPIFTLLVNELRENWEEYGINAKEVHQDYIDNENEDFVMSEREYSSWNIAFNGLVNQ
eukprot:TRINITY_DN11230_c0_g1_i1.p1 TRINITY_DN11230_c0_g1~~TRINITY_DN11230_c0_g1_i1.p1  ORF type:complete len:160 (-),score=35.27 TRINITY_DN11230_c0_g1_i1:37-516(-)